MSFADQLYDLLFEISSEDRHKILLYLNRKSANLTAISNETGLNLPETRRHISRLIGVELVERNPSGDYSLTNLGKIILEKINEVAFFSTYSEYFQSHTVDKIPSEFRKRLGELSSSHLETNVLSFVHKMEEVLKKAQRELILIVEQFPINYISLLIEAAERGVKVKILVPESRMFIPDLVAMYPEYSERLTRIKNKDAFEQRMINEIQLFLFASEQSYALTFPTLSDSIDYFGFLSNTEQDFNWVKDISHNLWNNADSRSKITSIKDDEIVIESRKKEQVIVKGRARQDFDIEALQDAVDNYSKVLLRGQFNLGNSTINITKSVEIIGEGRTNDIPDTKLYKQGWTFPFNDQSYLFLIRGPDIDVSIENLHFENFNGTCIGSREGNSLVFKRNRITLLSGHGRGVNFYQWGDHVVGITVGGEIGLGGFPGGILVEDNYLDFAISYVRGGFLSQSGEETEPFYRPDLPNHEAPICIGMNICRNNGQVIVRNNIIKNMNSKGIYVFDNNNTAKIVIHDNVIYSDVFGAYAYHSPIAGFGMLIQSAWTEPVSGAKIEVFNNQINLNKINYCGIAVYGPSMYQKGAGKLEQCVIRDNVIELKDGYIGLQIRKTDHAIVTNNQFIGRVYYGLQICGAKTREGIDLGSHENVFKFNDIIGLSIKPADDYSNTKVDGYTFTGSNHKSITADVWLDKYSTNNLIQVESGSKVIDEGKNN